MYQEHFGLNRPPFKITPDTSLFFEGNQRGAALDALLYAIYSGEGIIKVVGEVGSGKTMLCRMLEVRLSKDVDVIYIANPSLSPDNILHVIAHELHLDVSDDVSKVVAMQQIQAYLLKKHAGNRQVVLFVEEAQSMPIETLEEIRLLSNLETDQNKLLQMVLFGQPELDEKLAKPQIRQLKERITHSFHLSPFAPDDTLQYLNFRLRAVGYKGPDIFNKKTAGVVKRYSDGLTRRINIIADKSLLAAFSEGSHTITPVHVKTAAKDSEFRKAIDKKIIILIVLGFLLVVSALAGGFYLGKQEPVRPVSIKQSSVNEAALVMIESSTVLAENKKIDIQQSKQVVESATGLIAERMDKTKHWLAVVADEHYSIQLFMARTSDANKVEDFLRHTPETLDFSEIYIYETVINGRSWYSLLYSDFATRESAIDSLERLPSTLKASDPYLRRASAFKKESMRK